MRRSLASTGTLTRADAEALLEADDVAPSVVLAFLRWRWQPKFRGWNLTSLREDDVRVIRSLHADGRTMVSLGEEFGFTSLPISRIVHRITWRWVTDDGRVST